jgi:hypothetical protein
MLKKNLLSLALFGMIGSCSHMSKERIYFCSEDGTVQNTFFDLRSKSFYSNDSFEMGSFLCGEKYLFCFRSNNIHFMFPKNYKYRFFEKRNVGKSETYLWTIDYKKRVLYLIYYGNFSKPVKLVSCRNQDLIWLGASKNLPPQNNYGDTN